MYSFVCPNCSTPLRLRNLPARGEQIACPDCGVSINLSETPSGIEVTDVAPKLEFESARSVRSPVRFLTIFLVLAGLLISGFSFKYFFSRGVVDNSTGTSLSETRTVLDETTETQESSSESAPTVEAGEASPAVNVAKMTTEQRLEKISTLLNQYVRLHGAYPNGRFGEEEQGDSKFSWIVELMREESELLSIDPKREWSDPVNEAFVRRRLDLFLNPEVNTVVGEDRFPTTHFAGVSGVGTDAEKLPVRHPRAGIFSPYRTTRIEDVVDGIANTIMLVGVQSQLGSWARPGVSTLRSFSQEPYVNGPDGMGTGQPDSMFVLMADGSVRSISAETSPVVSRRMAAMADGLSLKAEEPGDPLTLPFKDGKATLVIANAMDAPSREPLIEPLFAPDTPVIEIDRALAQKIRAYRVEKPTPLATLLSELQELCGVPVDWSQLDDEILEKEIVITVENLAVKDLLRAVAEKAGVTLQVEKFSVQLRNLEEN